MVYLSIDRTEEHEQPEIFSSTLDSGEECSLVAMHNPILKQFHIFTEKNYNHKLMDCVTLHNYILDNGGKPTYMQ